MLIDFHTHVFPDRIAEAALSKLSLAGSMAPYGDATVKGAIQRMKLWGVDRSVVLNIATNPRQERSVNEFAVSLKETGKLIPFGSVHPDGESPELTVKYLYDSGIKGIKLHPDYMKRNVDDPRFDPIYKKAAELGMIVVLHAGYDFISPDYIHCTPEGVCRVLERFPGIRLVCAHMGGYRMWDRVKKHLCGKNIRFDTSLVAYDMSPEVFKEITELHGDDKILFGSDMPWCPPPSVLALVEASGIGSEAIENIKWRNAVKLLGE